MLEEKLYAPAHQDDSAGETMYPAYLVAMTSLAGLMAARRLQADGMLSPVRGNCVEEGDDVAIKARGSNGWSRQMGMRRVLNLLGVVLMSPRL